MHELFDWDDETPHSKQNQQPAQLQQAQVQQAVWFDDSEEEWD